MHKLWAMTQDDIEDNLIRLQILPQRVLAMIWYWVFVFTGLTFELFFCFQ